ncbi:MAG TPA: hypothetical protein PLB55_11010, partial [Prosthecobacter sp.]|nr:hypothetical protein [Prosthecobacter sp.]
SSRSRPLASFLQHTPQSHSLLTVHLQQPDGGTTHVGDPENTRALDTEVVFPQVIAWMEKTCQSIGVRIKAREVGSFEQIAELAGECQISLFITTAMLLGDDMLDMK